MDKRYVVSRDYLFLSHQRRKGNIWSFLCALTHIATMVVSLEELLRIKLVQLPASLTQASERIVDETSLNVLVFLFRVTSESWFFCGVIDTGYH
jgi:hypothetical protein